MRLGWEEGGKTGGAKVHWTASARGANAVEGAGCSGLSGSSGLMAEWITDDRTEPVTLCPLLYECWRPPSTSSTPSNGLQMSLPGTLRRAGLPGGERKLFRFGFLPLCNGRAAKHTVRRALSLIIRLPGKHSIVVIFC